MYVHCSVKGEPVPTLKWTLPGGVHVKPSQFLGRRLFVFPNGTLYVKNVSPVDAGRYEMCSINDPDYLFLAPPVDLHQVALSSQAAGLKSHQAAVGPSTGTSVWPRILWAWPKEPSNWR